MHAMESSDRRLRWEMVAEIVECDAPYRVLADRALGPGYFLEETIDSLQVVGVRMAGVSLLACVFQGGRWIDVVFDTSELTHVTFRHVYFQGVDFRGAHLRHLRFEHCVFAEGDAPEGEAVEKIGCYFREGLTAVSASPASVAPAPLAAPVKPVPEAPAGKAVAPPSPDRFDGLER